MINVVAVRSVDNDEVVAVEVAEDDVVAVEVVDEAAVSQPKPKRSSKRITKIESNGV